MNPPDPIGLAAAKAAQDASGDNTVILFGSRARGDHQPGSDVDLMVLHDDQPNLAYIQAKSAVSRHFAQNPPLLNVDILDMTRKEFHYCRRAFNHVAAQALRDGVIMSNERLDYHSGYEDEYPSSWPDVKERLTAAHRNLGGFEFYLNGRPEDQETCGFLAQQAIENALKGWLSAANLSYSNIHGLEKLAGIILENPSEAESTAGKRLDRFLDYTSYPRPEDPHQTNNWLTRYAVIYRYRGAGHRMGELERDRFLDEVKEATLTFINRAHELTGTNEADLLPQPDINQAP